MAFHHQGKKCSGETAFVIENLFPLPIRREMYMIFQASPAKHLTEGSVPTGKEIPLTAQPKLKEEYPGLY